MAGMIKRLNSSDKDGMTFKSFMTATVELLLSPTLFPSYSFKKKKKGSLFAFNLLSVKN